MMKAILVGNLDRDPAPRTQKNAPAAGNASGAKAADEAASLDGGRADYRFAAAPGNPALSDSLPDAKTLNTYVARFARTGRELHLIQKGGRCLYEIRRFDGCYTVSTVVDLDGLLRQVEAGPRVTCHEHHSGGPQLNFMKEHLHD
jgi:hypothetical protein